MVGEPRLDVAVGSWPVVATSGAYVSARLSMNVLVPASAYTWAWVAISRSPALGSRRGSSRMTRGALMMIDWIAGSIAWPSRASEQAKVSDA